MLKLHTRKINNEFVVIPVYRWLGGETLNLRKFIHQDKPVIIQMKQNLNSENNKIHFSEISFNYDNKHYSVKLGDCIIKKPDGTFVVTKEESVKDILTKIFDKIEMKENRKI